jgi:hypothetical protein
LLLPLAASVPFLAQPTLHKVQQLLARLQSWQERPWTTWAGHDSKSQLKMWEIRPQSFRF